VLGNTVDNVCSHRVLDINKELHNQTLILESPELEVFDTSPSLYHALATRVSVVDDRLFVYLELILRFLKVHNLNNLDLCNHDRRC
jgi:hypothetical protein